MPIFDLPALESLAGDYLASTLDLTPFSTAMIYACFAVLEIRENWSGVSIDGLTDSEWDTIETYIGDLAKALHDATAA